MSKMLAAAIVVTLSMISTVSCARPEGIGPNVVAPAPERNPVPDPAQAPALVSSVLVAHEDRIRVVDPESGLDARGYAPIAGSFPYALSTDGKTLAAIESIGESCEPFGGGSACRKSGDALKIVDLSTQQHTQVKLAGEGWVSHLEFNADATRLALVKNDRDVSRVFLLAADSGEVLNQRELEFRPSLVEFVLDGSTLVVYGQSLGPNPGTARPGPVRVLLLDAVSLATLWDQPLEDITSGHWCTQDCDWSHGPALFARWTPALALSHDRAKLFVVHADADRLTTVDLAARTTRSVQVRASRSWFEELHSHFVGTAEAKGAEEGAIKSAVLAPDGSRLYVAGQTRHAERSDSFGWQTITSTIKVESVDPMSGRRIASRELPSGRLSSLKLTPDGRQLLLVGSGEPTSWTEVLDAQTLERIHLLDGWELTVSRRLDGRPILVASQSSKQPTSLAVLDPTTFAVTNSWAANGYATWVEP